MKLSRLRSRLDELAKQLPGDTDVWVVTGDFESGFTVHAQKPIYPDDAQLVVYLDVTGNDPDGQPPEELPPIPPLGILNDGTV